MLQNSMKWFFFNVFLALLPLLLNFILIKIGRIKTTWFELLKDGELFFFSTSLAASSIGAFLFQSPSSLMIASVTSYLLITLLLISTGLFALSSFLKLKQMEAIDKKVFGAGSAWCAIIVILKMIEKYQM
ncbi:MAG: hypothetical protein ACR9NN_10665 [Nostochopsis sp.]